MDNCKKKDPIVPFRFVNSDVVLRDLKKISLFDHIDSRFNDENNNTSIEELYLLSNKILTKENQKKPFQN